MLTKHAGKSPVDLQLLERGTKSEANALEDGRILNRDYENILRFLHPLSYSLTAQNGCFERRSQAWRSFQAFLPAPQALEN